MKGFSDRTFFTYRGSDPVSVRRVLGYIGIDAERKDVILVRPPLRPPQTWR